MSKKITQSALKKILRYNKVTGIFVWISQTWNKSRVIGGVAGYVNNGSGYRIISIDSKNHRAHRLAFLYVEGYFPELEVDHINGCRDDNRWKNLRHSSHSCNMQNIDIRETNTSGFRGVDKLYLMDSVVYRARIRVSGKTVTLGHYKDIIDAALARVTFEEACDKWKCNSRDHSRIKLRSLGYKV